MALVLYVIIYKLTVVSKVLKTFRITKFRITMSQDQLKTHYCYCLFNKKWYYPTVNIDDTIYHFK